MSLDLDQQINKHRERRMRAWFRVLGQAIDQGARVFTSRVPGTGEIVYHIAGMELLDDQTREKLKHYEKEKNNY